MPHVLSQDLRNAVLQAAIQGKLVANNKDALAVSVKECITKGLDGIGFENWRFAYLENINNVVDCPHSTPVYTDSFVGYLYLHALLCASLVYSAIEVQQFTSAISKKRRFSQKALSMIPILVTEQARHGGLSHPRLL